MMAERRIRRVFAASVLAGVLFFGHGRSGSFSPAGSALAQTAAVPDVTERCIRSVVNISATRVVPVRDGRLLSPLYHNPIFQYFFGDRSAPDRPSEKILRGQGSGVIVRGDGIILTNNHIVENTRDLKITLHDGREFDVDVIGTDPETDLAVMRLRENVPDLEPLPFGDSDKLRLGEDVIAIGNPFGLGHTVTKGIVSALGRSGLGRLSYENFIQTDAAINPGNSGGALINLRGELVGINTMIVTVSGGYQGIGFAIPSNMAKGIMEKLITDGKIVRGWLGIGLQNLTGEIAKAIGAASVRGVLITTVMKDSPAMRAGIRPGDVIVEVNGRSIDSMDNLRNFIASLGIGEKAVLRIFRGGEEKDVEVVLAERPGKGRTPVSAGGGGKTYSGMTLSPLDGETRKRYDVSDDVKNGVVITDVQAGSSAFVAGLRAGDVIVGINRREVTSLEMFREEFRASKGNVLLDVTRGGDDFFKVLKK